MWTGLSVHSKMTSLNEDYLSLHPTPLQDPQNLILQDGSVIFLPGFLSHFSSVTLCSVCSLLARVSLFLESEKVTQKSLSQGSFAGLISKT